ncbi:MAG: tRNA pseudouridine(38-40) synthase TruA [Deltaproteobacteria bacterium]|nr:tRNA pseudouridine(38-40) synthase TruA [Deltaproteobacteria bacterium]
MKNYKLILQYHGAGFCGWQMQNDKISIQSELIRALEKIFRQKITVIASGRTDAGVHALGQVVSFRCEGGLTKDRLKAAINFYLGPEIIVSKIEEVDFDFHAQKDAKQKLYRYLILNQTLPHPLLIDATWHVPFKINWKLVQAGLKLLEGKKDFRAFQSVGTPVKSTVRTLFSAKLKKIKTPYEVSLYAIEWIADGFLKQMVRNMVGTLVDVGRGKISLDQLEEVLRSCDRKKAGPAAPAQGLYLVKVDYF